MKARNALLPVLATATLIFAGAAFAQDQTGQTQPPPSQDSMQQPPAQTAAPAPMPPPDVTVRSVPPAAPQLAPAPPFSQLSGGGKSITEEQAAAYPPLANDFLNASHGAQRINKTQYEAWVKQMQ
ncbi:MULTISPECIES: hypothetical protein [Rhodanobacter]|uniref:Classical arabinogalactan protein 4 n=1 Tax=Rhodanobacter hydrolyticus TaxID=2250595 RepID=A0ABW8J428_9GAMM|nr:hypothetical protein [Rhodanobacter sp. 7MK24]MBD8879291.1 hypothetical protein [Rhodanobacter sp. 7MK24]